MLYSKLIASPLNYTGNKFQLLPQILPYLPPDINTFIDLFSGGCTVGININAPIIVFNDNLKPLVNMFKAFKESSIQAIMEHIYNRINTLSLSRNNKDGYLKLREIYNKEQNTLDLYLLSAYSFNNQIRFNNTYEFNMPFGKRIFNASLEKKLKEFVKELHIKNVEFSAKNFYEFDFANLNETDFVYCDPPYLLSTATYNEGQRGVGGWNEELEKQLLAILDNLSQRDIRFALSNVIEHKGSENKILKDWIKDNNYNVFYLNKHYSHCNYHLKDRDRSHTVEVLVTNYFP